MGTIRREALDHLLIFGRRHLEHVVFEFVDHYHGARPHQSLGQRVPSYAAQGGISGPDRSCDGIAWAASSMSTAGSLDGENVPNAVEFRERTYREQCSS